MDAKQESSKSPSRLLRWGGIGVFLLSIGSKLKSFLPLLKFGKFGGTFITMLVSVWAYALLFTWQFAVGLVVMIFIHEMGHIWAAKRKGVKTSAPAFIPFIGALIMMKQQPQDAKTEAYIAFGGPILGTIGAILCYGLGVWTGHGLYFAIAYIGLMLNLFNLLPIHPLDGGRIAVAITRWLWGVGLVLGLFFIIYLRSFILIFIYLLFVWELWLSFRGQKPKTVHHTIRFPSTRFEEVGAFLPGVEHQRELPFTQYCDLDTKKHYFTISYPGVGEIYRLEGIKDGVHQVRLMQTNRSEFNPDQVEMKIELTMTSQTVIEKSKQYYEVDTKSRWGYGLTYIGLAAVLVTMMIITQSAMPDPTLMQK